MASFYLNPLVKDPVSQYSHILGSWGLVSASTYKLGGGHTGAHDIEISIYCVYNHICMLLLYIYVLLKNLAIVQNKLAGCGQSAEAARM